MTHSQTAIPTEREDRSHEAPLATPNALSERRVGIEVEFGGLSARAAARLIQDHAGGELEELDPHRFMLHGTSLGELTLELDSKFAHGKLGASALEKSLRDFVGLVSDPIVPTELITNPLPVSKIGALDEMLLTLSKQGAVGTDRPHLACGLHLNIEHGFKSVDGILAILRAYMLLAPALREAIAPDMTRKILPFIGRYPEHYVNLVLNEDYEPDFQQFVLDYCAANPNKNRELDLLPLLAAIDKDAVTAALGHEPEAIRPTFHYRLPNTRLGQDGWSVQVEWERWLSVEELATDQKLLETMLFEWHRKEEDRRYRRAFTRQMRGMVRA